MGQVCSGAGMGKNVQVPRDPADKELDEIEMKETRIADFDAFFEKASAPLNQLVEMHNSIAQCEENLKAAASAIQGEAQVKLIVTGSARVEFVVWVYDSKQNEHVLSEGELNERTQNNPALHEAYERVRSTVDQLNSALEQPSNTIASQFSEKLGRMKIMKHGAQDKYIREVNIALFTLRKQLMLQANVSRLSDGFTIFIKELMKVEELGPLSIESDDETGAFKIMCGDEELNLRDNNKLSKPAAQLRDAIVDLIDNVETAATSLPELTTQTEELMIESQEFPSKVPEAVSSSELKVTEVPKAARATSANVKAIGHGPKIAKATMHLMKTAATEIQEAVSVPLGA